MRILVYNYKKQYALSRKQIEIIMEIMPKEFFIPIRDFHISWEVQYENFEFDYKNKIAYFTYPVEEKNNTIIQDAVKTLLIGLARIKSKDKFFTWINDDDKELYFNKMKDWYNKIVTKLVS